MSEAPSPDPQKPSSLTASLPQATLEPAAATVSAVRETEYTQGVQVSASFTKEQASDVFHRGWHDTATRAHGFQRLVSSFRIIRPHLVLIVAGPYVDT